MPDETPVDNEFREVGEPDEQLRAALLYYLEHRTGTPSYVAGFFTHNAELAELLRRGPPPPPRDQPAPSPMAVPSRGGLTTGELALIRKLGECCDWREALALVHQLQLLVMARLAARIHPDIFG